MRPLLCVVNSMHEQNRAARLIPRRAGCRKQRRRNRAGRQSARFPLSGNSAWWA